MRNLELVQTPPENCNLKVGDTVEWENDAGIKWQHKIIGFNYTRWYNKKYKKYVHLDSEAYWFPHNHLELKKIN